MTLLEQIVEDLKKVDISQIKAPEGSEDDSFLTIVGEMSDDLKKIFGLRNQYADRGNAVLAEAKRQIIDMDVDATGVDNEYIRESLLAKNKHELVDRLFWTSVKHTYPELLLVDVVVVTRDWKIGWRVDYESRVASLLADLMLKSLLS